MGRSILQCVRDIRRMDVGRFSWSFRRATAGAGGLRVSCEWVKREFPEFAGATLDPWIEYLLNFDYNGVPRRGYVVGGSKPLRTRGYLFWIGSILSLAFFVAAVVIGHSSRFLFIFWILVAGLRVLRTGKLFPHTSLPRTPMRIAFCSEPSALQELQMAPIATRDLLLAHIAQYYRPVLYRNETLWLYVFLYAAVPITVLVMSHSLFGALCAFIPVSLIDLLLQACKGGEILLILNRYQKALWQGTQWRRRDGKWRRFLRSLSVIRAQAARSIAGMIYLAPVLVVVILGLCCIVAIGSLVNRWAFPCIALVAFTMARSPLPIFFHRHTRLRTHEAFVKVHRRVDLFRAATRRQVFGGRKD